MRISQHVLLLLLWCVAKLSAELTLAKKRVRFALVTYMNKFNPRFGYLQHSAEAHGIWPQVLGYGEEAWWPDGLGAKINALRRYVFAECSDDDIVLFVDAFDVIIFSSKDSIIKQFTAMEREYNRSLFFNAEYDCFPNLPDICTEDYPESPHATWKYLNSGAFIGRASAMKLMLKHPVDNIIAGSDQAFYQRYFRQFPGRVARDTSCRLLCAILEFGGTSKIDLRDEQLVNSITGTSPAIVHFVSSAHWSVWKNDVPTTILHEAFRLLYPTVSARLFDSIELSYQIGGLHYKPLVKLRGSGRDAYFALMRLVICIQCRLLFGTSHECANVPSLTCTMCGEVHLLAVVVIMCSSATYLGRRYAKSLRKVHAEPSELKGDKAV